MYLRDQLADHLWTIRIIQSVYEVQHFWTRNETQNGLGVTEKIMFFGLVKFAKC